MNFFFKKLAMWQERESTQTSISLQSIKAASSFIESIPARFKIFLLPKSLSRKSTSFTSFMPEVITIFSFLFISGVAV